MAFKLENIWFAIAFMVVGITVVLAFYNETTANYGIPSDNSSLSKINTKLNEIYSPSLDMKSKIQGGEVTSDDAVNNMMYGGYTAVRNNPFTVAAIGLNATNIMVNEASPMLGGINGIFVIAIGTIIVVSIAFAILYMLFRYRVF